MSPSVVPHPEQSGLTSGSQRIILSLRAVGEGHISSIAFREGIITSAGGFDLLPEPPFATAANSMSDRVPEDGVEVFRNEDTTLSGTVIFPMTPAQRNGLEDRSEEHTSELQSLMRISYAVFCLKKKTL